jgi:hypothetical protein
MEFCDMEIQGIELKFLKKKYIFLHFSGSEMFFVFVTFGRIFQGIKKKFTY